MRPAKSTLVLFASSVLNTIAGFLATLYIARTLGPGPLGQYAIVLAFVFWIHVPAKALDWGINKRVSEGEDQGAFLAAGVVMNAALLVVSALLILAFSGYLDAYVGADVSRLVLALLFSYFAMNTLSAGLQGQKKIAESGVVWSIGDIGKSTLQIVLVALGFGLVGLVAGHAVAYVVGALSALLFYSVSPVVPTRRHVRSLIDYAKYSWGGMLRSRAFGWMDTIVLAFFVDAALIGVYEVSWTLASTLVIVSGAISNTLFPDLSELSAEGAYDEVRHLLDEGLVFAGVFAIPGLFGAAIVGPRVLGIYGDAFSRGEYVLLLLILARLVNGYGGQFLNTINAVDRPDRALRINAIFVVANLTLNVSLVWTFGWVGAAAATALSSFVAMALSYRALEDIIDSVDVPSGEIGRQVLAGLVMSVILYPLVGITPNNDVPSVGLVLLGSAIYVGVLLTISRRVRTKMVSLVPGRVQPD